MILCSTVQFGGAFTGNSQSPLQQEIEAYMDINDAEFNLLCSFRSLGCIIMPFFIPMLMERVGIATTVILVTLTAQEGQRLFIWGLQSKSYQECALSRLVFGASDSLSIV